jgi:hypothetical protein
MSSLAIHDALCAMRTIVQTRALRMRTAHARCATSFNGVTRRSGRSRSDWRANAIP